MTEPTAGRSHRRGAAAVVLVTCMFAAGCGGDGTALPTATSGPSIGAEASGLGVTLPLPDGWVSASAGERLVVAELEGDLTRAEPEGSRLVITRGGDGASTAEDIRIPLVTGEDGGTGIAAVVEEPREVTVGGRDGVSIGVEERVGSTLVVRRYVFVGVGAETLQFVLEAPTDRWPGGLAALEAMLDSAATEPEPDSGASPASTTAEATATTPPRGVSLIAFMSDRDGTWNIYVMNADGSGQTRLTTSAGRNSQPAWSPDGSSIAFRSDRDGNPEIYVMNADGSSAARLTTSAGSDIDPAWSPDGSRIAFASDRDGNREIYVMDADGSSPVRLTTSPRVDYRPTWSPDGSRIAFSSNRDGDWDTYVMNADGSSQVRLTNSPGADSHAAWSPDGSRIAFSSDRDGDWNIYVMDADGSNQTRLTTSTAWDSNPAWSPDGSSLAFTSNRDGDWNIYVMGADGAKPTPLTTSTAGDFTPAWSP